MENPLVSIIIPFYSEADWLDECLVSVKNQTFNNYEVIVVNDGSDINIDYIINKFPKFKFVKIENSGPGNARNTGVKLAKGKYIAFLDSDDIWDKRKLEIQIAEMEINNHVWSQTSLVYFGNINKKVKTNFYKKNTFLYSLTSLRIQTSSIVIQREKLLTTKMFNAKKRYGQDIYLWIELAYKYDIGCIDDYLTYFRIRENNAGFDVTKQLNSKNSLYTDIKDNYFNFNFSDIPFFIQVQYKLINLQKKYVNTNNNTVNKLLYFFPWIMLKIYANLIIPKIKERG